MKSLRKYIASKEASERWLEVFMNDNRDKINSYLKSIGETLFPVDDIEYFGTFIRIKGGRLYRNNFTNHEADIPLSIFD